MCKFFFPILLLLLHAWEVTSAKYLVCIFLDLHAYIHLHIRKHLTWGFCYVLAVWGASPESWQQPQAQQLQGPALFEPRSCDQPITENRGTPKAGPFMLVRTPLGAIHTNLPWPWQGLCSCSTASDSSHQSPILPLPWYVNIYTMM